MKAIILIDRQWGIGFEGKQPLYLKSDLKRFSQLTAGGTIIVGHNTLKTFPNEAPLSGRRNLVLSRSKLEIPGATIYNSMDALLKDAPEDSWVVGGSSVFHQLISKCKCAYVTYADVELEVDRLFPNLDQLPNWNLEYAGDWHVENDIRYQYRIYSNTLL